MRSTFREVSAWILALSLLDGLLLPFLTKPAVVDPDGACGPVLVLAHSIEHFEAPLQAEANHCALCHLWNTMASASTSPRAEFVPPMGLAGDAAAPLPDRAAGSKLSDASPRGPPARS